MLIGIVQIYLKYGKYEISSDKHRIYITQGILNETSFSIAKQNVQAIEMKQSMIKRMLGIIEVTLISAGNAESDNDDLAFSSLYPFLKKQRAYAILEEILPTYQVTEEMDSFTHPALWLRLFRGVPFYLIPAALLFYFKPEIWEFLKLGGSLFYYYSS